MSLSLLVKASKQVSDSGTASDLVHTEKGVKGNRESVDEAHIGANMHTPPTMSTTGRVDLRVRFKRKRSVTVSQSPLRCSPEKSNPGVSGDGFINCCHRGPRMKLSVSTFSISFLA